MIYGTISQGFLSGAFNDEININFVPELEPLVTIQPEYVTNYEVGFKGTLADGRVRLATTFFYMDYSDKQENVDIDNGDGRFGPNTQVGVTTNASTVEIHGMEFELRAQSWDGGFLSLDVGYLENEYGEFTSFDPDAPGQVVDRSSVTIRDFSPQWTVTTSVEHTFLLANGASLTPNLSVYWQADYDFTAGLEGGPPSKCHQQSYALVRARANYQPPGGAWQASLFGSNVTDQRYFSFCNNGRAGVYDYTYGTPDRWGLEFQMNSADDEDAPWRNSRCHSSTQPSPYRLFMRRYIRLVAREVPAMRRIVAGVAAALVFQVVAGQEDISLEDYAALMESNREALGAVEAAVEAAEYQDAPAKRRDPAPELPGKPAAFLVLTGARRCSRNRHGWSGPSRQAGRDDESHLGCARNARPTGDGGVPWRRLRRLPQHLSRRGRRIGFFGSGKAYSRSKQFPSTPGNGASTSRSTIASALIFRVNQPSTSRRS